MASCLHHYRALMMQSNKLQRGIFVRQFLQCRHASKLPPSQPPPESVRDRTTHANITSTTKSATSFAGAVPIQPQKHVDGSAAAYIGLTATVANADAKKPTNSSERPLLFEQANVGDRINTVAAAIPRLTNAAPAYAENRAASNTQTVDTTMQTQYSESTPYSKRLPPTAETVDISAFTDNSYVTQLRAMSEYLLKSADLKECRIAYKRSPYSDKTEPVAVYWRKDVELRAIEVWGSLDALRREKSTRKQRLYKQQRELSALKKALRTYTKLRKYMQGSHNDDGGMSAAQKRSIEATHSIVKSAILVNGLNTVLKFIAWIFTNSHTMFAEMVHSFADLLNQIVLYIGILESGKKPDTHHPYGYTQLRHVYALISGVGIFFFGGGVNIYHGIHGLMEAPEVMPLTWAFATLAFGLVSESYVLIKAIQEIRISAKQLNVSFSNFIRRGCDPQTSIVFLEDTAAVAGVIIAGTCVTLTHITQSHLFDCVGSVAVGALLAVVSGVVIRANSSALVGRSIPEESEIAITRDLESDHIIRAVYDVKTVDMGGYNVRYKAEVDIDGREVTRSYLERQDLESVMADARKIATVDDLETFMLKHGENIVDMLGAEVDRIEANLRKKHPLVRHIDLEVL